DLYLDANTPEGCSSGKPSHASTDDCYREFPFRHAGLHSLGGTLWGASHEHTDSSAGLSTNRHNYAPSFPWCRPWVPSPLVGNSIKLRSEPVLRLRRCRGY